MPLLHTKLNDVSGVSAAAARATLPEGIDVATAADKNTGHADDASANVPVRIRAELQACWTLGEQPARLLNSLVDDIVLCADAVLLVTQSGVLFSETTANKDSTLADTIGDSGGGGGRNKTLECQLLTRSRSQEGSEAHESLVLTTTTQQPPQEQVTGIIVLDALALCAPSYSRTSWLNVYPPTELTCVCSSGSGRRRPQTSGQTAARMARPCDDGQRERSPVGPVPLLAQGPGPSRHSLLRGRRGPQGRCERDVPGYVSVTGGLRLMPFC